MCSALCHAVACVKIAPAITSKGLFTDYDRRYHNIHSLMGQTSRRRRVRRSRDPFWDLVATAKRLQAPDGCPWDRAQTVSSLLPYVIEEMWEVFEVIRSRRYEELEEELGDVLYGVIFLTLVTERRGRCSLRSLLMRTRAKMIRRHPHVFGTATAASPQSAYRQWELTKRQEGRRRHSPSKAFRQLLVSWWDWLHRHPEAAEGRAARYGGRTPPRHRRPDGERKS